MSKRIQKAIDIFLDALNNGTLAKGTCTACAVGNLVAYGMNVRIIRLLNKYNDNTTFITDNYDKKIEAWAKLFSTSTNFFSKKSVQNIRKQNIDNSDVIKCIEATDFTWQELAEIEYAFEANTEISYDDYSEYLAQEIREDLIKGAEAVIKVMMEFDDVKKDVKEIFTSKAESIKV